MRTKPLSIAAVCAFVAIGGIVFLVHRRNVILLGAVDVAIDSVSGKSLPNRALSATQLPEHGKKKRNEKLPTSTARDVYFNEKTTLVTRFAALAKLADAGDADAKHLMFQIQQDCQMWPQLVPSKFVAWKPEMGPALSSLQARCTGLASLPEYQKLSQITADQPRDAFDQDIRYSIRKAFADSGEDSALAQAMSAYQRRPDGTTATVIAETLGNLDITNFNENFPIEGSAALSPTYRQSIFQTSLELLACEYGQPCGPDSAVVAAFCINGGVCFPGMTLQDIYEQKLLSGEDAANVNAILTALHKRGW